MVETSCNSSGFRHEPPTSESSLQHPSLLELVASIVQIIEQSQLIVRIHGFNGYGTINLFTSEDVADDFGADATSRQVGAFLCCTACKLRTFGGKLQGLKFEAATE